MYANMCWDYLLLSWGLGHVTITSFQYYLSNLRKYAKSGTMQHFKFGNYTWLYIHNFSLNIHSVANFSILTSAIPSSPSSFMSPVIYVGCLTGQTKSQWLLHTKYVSQQSKHSCQGTLFTSMRSKSLLVQWTWTKWVKRVICRDETKPNTNAS